MSVSFGPPIIAVQSYGKHENGRAIRHDNHIREVLLGEWNDRVSRAFQGKKSGVTGKKKNNFWVSKQIGVNQPFGGA